MHSFQPSRILQDCPANCRPVPQSRNNWKCPGKWILSNSTIINGMSAKKPWGRRSMLQPTVLFRLRIANCSGLSKVFVYLNASHIIIAECKQSMISWWLSCKFCQNPALHFYGACPAKVWSEVVKYGIGALSLVGTELNLYTLYHLESRIVMAFCVLIRTFLLVTRQRKWNWKFWNVYILLFDTLSAGFFNHVCSTFWSWVWITYFFYLGCN